MARTIKEGADAARITKAWIAPFAVAKFGRYPVESETLFQIVYALLKRVEKKNRKEADHLRAVIQVVCAVEVMLSDAGKNWRKQLPGKIDWEKELSGIKDYLVATLATGAARRDHIKASIRFQKSFLMEFFSRNPIRRNIDSNLRKMAYEFSDISEWLDSHGSEISSFLSMIPCPCGMNTFEEGNTDKAALRRWLKNPISLGAIYNAILAHLHKTTPDQIKKILKP